MKPIIQTLNRETDVSQIGPYYHCQNPAGDLVPQPDQLILVLSVKFQGKIRSNPRYATTHPA